MSVSVHIYGTNIDICYEVARLGFYARSRKTSEPYRALDVQCYGGMVTEEGVFLIKDGTNSSSVLKIPASEYRYVCIENYDSAKDRNKREISQLMEEMGGINNGKAN